MQQKPELPVFTPQPPFAMPTGAPPQAAPPSGVARAYAFVRSLSGTAVVLAVVVFTFQAVMPEGRRPSDIIGSFHGSTRSAELNSEREAQINTAGGMANAQAGAQANWQMEQQLFQTQQQAAAAALQTQQDAANLADFACLAGGALTALFGHDADQYAKPMQGACGAGDQIRHNITNSLVDTARSGSGTMQRPMAVPPAFQSGPALAAAPQR